MSAATITIRQVTTPAEQKVFVEFPWTLYKDDPNWVPPLLSSRQKLMDKAKNPGWEYLTGDYFIAWRGAEPVGTVAAYINPRHNDTWNEQIGWFGAFECIHDQEVATALLRTAAGWVRAKGGYTAMRGPVTFTCNDDGWGLLIENFARPVLLMPYNPPYYQTLIENAGVGLGKAMDLVSYYCDPQTVLDNPNAPYARYKRLVEQLMKRNQITVRQPDPKRLREELDLLREIYVKAWEKNWGNVPPTDHEMDQLFADLKQFFEPDLAQFVYVKGQIAGFFLGLPDFYEVLALARPHPRTPELWTLLKALWHWKVRPKMRRSRVLLFGILPEYRRMGADAVCFLQYFDQVVRGRYPILDAGWILETNEGMKKLAEGVGATIYKRYRIYEAAL
jgi:hypothetical protein